MLLGWNPPLWAVFWTIAGAGLVALTMWKTSSEAVQPSLGCRNDVDMSFALHGSEYTGPYEQTVKGCCKTRVLPVQLASDMNSAVWCAWHQWLPSFLILMVRGLDDLSEFHGDGDLALMPNEVMRFKKYFDSLVDTPIDKCSQHLLIW